MLETKVSCFRRIMLGDPDPDLLLPKAQLAHGSTLTITQLRADSHTHPRVCTNKMATETGSILYQGGKV